MHKDRIENKIDRLKKERLLLNDNKYYMEIPKIPIILYN
jgi:hypothetical protein